MCTVRTRELHVTFGAEVAELFAKATGTAYCNLSGCATRNEFRLVFSTEPLHLAVAPWGSVDIVAADCPVLAGPIQRIGSPILERDRQVRNRRRKTIILHNRSSLSVLLHQYSFESTTIGESAILTLRRFCPSTASRKTEHYRMPALSSDHVLYESGNVLAQASPSAYWIYARDLLSVFVVTLKYHSLIDVASCAPFFSRPCCL